MTLVDQSSRAVGGRKNRRPRAVEKQKSVPGVPNRAHARDTEDLRLPGYARYTFPGRGDPARAACAFAAQTLRQWDMEQLRDQIVPTLTELIRDAVRVDPQWRAHDRAPQLIMLRHQHLLACAITRLRDETAARGALDLATRPGPCSPAGGWMSGGTQERDIWLVFANPQ
jgi:hypothetical protein